MAAQISHKGVLSSERTYRLKTIEHLYVDVEGCLDLGEPKKIVLPSKPHCAKVALLKAAELKAYMTGILVRDMSPLDSLAKVY